MKDASNIQKITKKNMNMKKIVWTLAFVFALQMGGMSAIAAAPKDTVSQVEFYSDTTSLDSAMTADMGDWDEDYDEYDEDWESLDSKTLVGRMGLNGMFGSMVFVIIICFIFFVLAPVAVIGIILYFVYRNRKEKMRLMEMAIKNGNSIPMDVLGTPCKRGDELWNKGIKQVFLGVGLAILLGIIIDELGLAIGALITLIGLGNLAIGYSEKQKQRDQDLRERYFNQNKEESVEEK